MIPVNTCWGSYALVGMSMAQQGNHYFVSAIDTASFATGRSFRNGKQSSLDTRAMQKIVIRFSSHTP